MTSEELRKKFLEFFEKKGHKVVASSSLLPSDPSVLFTTAGMQQFKEYYLGKPSPYGNRVTSCQKCFRTSDIEQIGDNKHLTFLEMLGNFSFGDYFKKETIGFALELLNSKFQIPNSKLWFTYFGGDSLRSSAQSIPEDKQSLDILEKLKISKNRICPQGKEENFWGPTGKEGPCGPTVEIHYDLTGKPCQNEENCIPNCECGRFVELWNLVYNEYYQAEDGKLSLLEQKGVDTGMGLERLTMILQKKESVFETDLFFPIISEIKKMSKVQPKPSSFERLFAPAIVTDEELEKTRYERYVRITADHIKGSVFLAAEGILPSNLKEGYVLRRIIRRAIRYGALLNLPKNFLISLAQKVIETYKNIYPEIKIKKTDILTIFQNEEEKFRKMLERGIKETTSKVSETGRLNGEIAFNLYQSYGMPLEFSREIAIRGGVKIPENLEEEFIKALKRHRRVSRVGAEKKFGGVGKKADLAVTKLHTATHLLHAALREILGPHVKQMGSDINPKRLRFDFSHSQKMTDEEIKKVEDLVNQKIKEDLKVKKEEMPYEKAVESGALAFFKEKYPKIVSVYSIGDPSDPSGQVFSKEICAGPHVKQTSELGHFKIIKEESSASGVRRIKAILDNGFVRRTKHSRFSSGARGS